MIVPEPVGRLESRSSTACTKSSGLAAAAALRSAGAELGSACIITAVAAANCVVFGNSLFASSSKAISGLTASSSLPSGRTSSFGHDLSVVVLTLSFCWTPLHGSIRAGHVATNPVSATRSPSSSKISGRSASTTGCSHPTSGAESSVNCFATAS